MHCAVRYGNDKITLILLEHHTNTETISKKDGRTALHIAAEYGFEEIVNMLLNHGADVEAKDKYECTALHLSTHRGYAKIVEILLKNGANTEAKTMVKLLFLFPAVSSNFSVLFFIRNTGQRCIMLVGKDMIKLSPY